MTPDTPRKPARPLNKAVGDEDPTYIPMTERGDDGRAHLVEDLKRRDRPEKRLDQPAPVVPKVPLRGD